MRKQRTLSFFCVFLLFIVGTLQAQSPPTAGNESVTAQEDALLPKKFKVLLNNSDPDGDELSIFLTFPTSFQGGAIAIVADTTISYVPPPGYYGPDTVIYQVCDDENPPNCISDTLFITVNATNDAPVVSNDTIYAIEDNGIVFNPIDNDYDPIDPGSGIDLATLGFLQPGPVNGLSSIDHITGDVTYMPDQDFCGLDSTMYVVCDFGSPPPILCNLGWIYINVACVNDPPIVNNDTVVVSEDNVVTINPLNNDEDPEEPGSGLDPASTTLDSGPNHGTAVLNPVNGFIVYTPTPNFCGLDTIHYTVCDSGVPVQCNSGMMVITVNCINDAPVANDDSVLVLEDNPLTFDPLINDGDPFDADGALNPASVGFVVQPVNGTATTDPLTGMINYVPDLEFCGLDSLQYAVCDSGTPTLCDMAWVHISVACTNDEPLAIDDVVSVFEDMSTPLFPLVNDLDTGSTATVLDTNSLTIIQAPTHGATTVNTGSGSIIFTPDANYCGPDSLQYAICDFGIPVLCDSAWMFIDVACVNDNPHANDDNVTVTEDTPATFNPTLNDNDDNDADGQLDPGSLGVLQGPFHGSVTLDPITGSMVYTPNPNFCGPDSLQYSICDTMSPALCDTAWVYFDVECVNDAPVANDDNPTVIEDTPSTFNPLDNDGDPFDTGGSLDPASVAILLGPFHGTAVVNPNGSITYDPDPDYCGPDSMQYTVCDSSNPALCDTAWISFDVQCVNDAPIVNEDMVTVDEDNPITFDPLVNDSDPADVGSDIDPTSVEVLLGPFNGSATVDPVTGEITYTPDPDFCGQDSMQYVACDEGVPALCDTAWIYMEVVCINEPTQANDDSVDMVNEDGDVVINVLGNDIDPEGENLTITDFPCLPEYGTVIINGNGTVTYTLDDPTFVGVDSFCYEVCDDGVPVSCDIAAVVVNVLDGNQAPEANDDNASTTVGEGLTINVTANDFDTEGGLLTVTGFPCLPSNGVAGILPPGDVIYQPNDNFSGVDSFCYVVCDDVATPKCDTAMVYVQVGNSAPVAEDDNASTQGDLPVTLDPTNNDSDADGQNLTVTELPCSPAFGTATIGSNNEVTYEANFGEYGVDSFCYVVCDDASVPACDTAWVYVDVVRDDVFHIPSAFTPNGDSYNDVFYITGLESFPGTKVLIYNRWGNLVYKTDDYMNDWGGVNLNGNPLPEGTYFYVIDLNNDSDKLSGYIYIHR